MPSACCWCLLLNTHYTDLLLVWGHWRRSWVKLMCSQGVVSTPCVCVCESQWKDMPLPSAHWIFWRSSQLSFSHIDTHFVTRGHVTHFWEWEWDNKPGILFKGFLDISLFQSSHIHTFFFGTQVNLYSRVCVCVRVIESESSSLNKVKRFTYLTATL